MTKERTLEQIKVMQAWVDGRECEWHRHGENGWRTLGGCDTHEITFNFELYEYRVKPEPRTIWVSFCHDGTPGLVTESEEIARRWKSSCTNCIAKFTEVLDGQC